MYHSSVYIIILEMVQKPSGNIGDTPVKLALFTSRHNKDNHLKTK